MRPAYWILKRGKWVQVSRDEFDAFGGKRYVSAEYQTPAWYSAANLLASYAGRVCV